MSLSIDKWHMRYLQQAGWTQDLRRYIYQKSSFQQAAKILDVGCGTGVLEKELSNTFGAVIYAVDIYSEPLEFAQGYAPNSFYTVADGFSLPFPGALFDISLCHFLLLWLQNPHGVIMEMSRVTKPGGYVVALAEPDYGGRIDFPSELAQLGTWQTEALKDQGANPVVGRQIRYIFARAGLEDIETGVLGAQWRQETADYEHDMEWQVLSADLEKNPDFTRQSIGLKEIERAARLARQRVLFVPVFYALGKVGNHSAAGRPISS